MRFDLDALQSPSRASAIVAEARQEHAFDFDEVLRQAVASPVRREHVERRVEPARAGALVVRAHVIGSQERATDTLGVAPIARDGRQEPLGTRGRVEPELALDRAKTAVLCVVPRHEPRDDPRLGLARGLGDDHGEALARALDARAPEPLGVFLPVGVAREHEEVGRRRQRRGELHGAIREARDAVVRLEPAGLAHAEVTRDARALGPAVAEVTVAPPGVFVEPRPAALGVTVLGRPERAEPVGVSSLGDDPVAEITRERGREDVFRAKNEPQGHQAAIVPRRAPNGIHCPAMPDDIPHLRPCPSLDELPRLTALVRDAWRHVGPCFECAPGDLLWRAYRFPVLDTTGDIALCEDSGGSLLGFAWRFANGDVDLIVRPDRTRDAVVAPLLAWAEERHRATPPASGRPLTAWALESNAALRQALTRTGYTRADGHYVHRARSLADPPPPVAVPDGYTVRAVAGLDEAPLRAEVHRRAFRSARVTDAGYRRLMEVDGYDPDLDVVAVAPDGAFAAFTLAWLDPTLALGLFEPVGTTPDHQRRGLARAVGVEALRRLRDRGATTALVGAHGEDPASNALYESLGFREVARNVAFVRV